MKNKNSTFEISYQKIKGTANKRYMKHWWKKNINTKMYITYIEKQSTYVN